MTNFVPQKTNISIREILSDEDLISVLDALKEEQDKVLYNREELKKYDLVFWFINLYLKFNRVTIAIEIK